MARHRRQLRRHAPERLGSDASPERPSVHHRGAGDKRSKSQILLLALTIEKIVQHLFVTYAFAVDLGDIRDTVVIDHEPLMVAGIALGLLFAVSARQQIANRRAGYRLLVFLALFDVVAEFIAQGTLAIDIVVSIVVATIILVTLFFNRDSLLTN